jgi:hypothetical protein
MKTLLAELLLALVSIFGLTVLAYRHPKAYRRIFPPMLIGLWFIVLLACARDAGINQGYNTALRYIPPQQWRNAQAALEWHKVISVQVVFWFFAVQIYLLLLFFLHSIFRIEHK